MKQLKRRIYRERRRMAILGVLATMAGYLLFQEAPGTVLGLPIAIPATLAFGAAVPILSLFIALVIPTYRFSLELGGVVLLLFSGIARLFPEAYTLMLNRLEITILVGIFFGMALATLFYGDWSDRFLRWGSYVERSLVMSDMATTCDVWRALCPIPENQATYWNQEVAEITKIEGQAQTYRLRYRFPDGKWMDQQVQFDQIKPGKYFRYEFRTIDDQRPGGQYPKIVTVNLEQREWGVTVHFRLERRDYPFRKALVNWIDDYSGRNYDKAIGRAEEATDQVAGDPQLVG